MNASGSASVPMDLDVSGPSASKRAKQDPLTSVSELSLADDVVCTLASLFALSIVYRLFSYPPHLLDVRNPYL